MSKPRVWILTLTSRPTAGLADLLKEMREVEKAQGKLTGKDEGRQARAEWRRLLQRAYKETGMAKLDAVKVCVSASACVCVYVRARL